MEGRGGPGGRRGFGRGGQSDFAPKPVEVGQEYDVDIQEMSRRGEGIARVQGFVIFVPNAKTGDHIKIKVTKISRRFAEAEAVGAAVESAEEKPGNE